MYCILPACFALPYQNGCTLYTPFFKCAPRWGDGLLCARQFPVFHNTFDCLLRAKWRPTLGPYTLVLSQERQGKRAYLSYCPILLTLTSLTCFTCYQVQQKDSDLFLLAALQLLFSLPINNFPSLLCTAHSFILATHYLSTFHKVQVP